MNDEIKFHPEKFKNTYKHWMENIRDWNISRQLWWGQRIPAYYYGDGENDFVVAENIDEALKLAKAKNPNLELFKELEKDAEVNNVPIISKEIREYLKFIIRTNKNIKNISFKTIYKDDDTRWLSCKL